MMRSLPYLLVCLWPFAMAAEIHHCVGDAGEPVFSQRACGAESTRVTITPPAAASSGAGLRDSERAWLATRERREAKPPPGKRRANKASADPQRQAYRCRAKRRALDAVKAELRRGYKPAKGERLRRRRRAHEDYLSTFCS